MTDADKAVVSTGVDNYLAKQKRLADAVAITRGESASNIMMQRNLRNEYERLYKTGLDPTSAGMVKLKTELDSVTASITTNASSVKAQAVAVDIAQKASIAYATAIGSAGIALVANTVDIAKQVDTLTEQASTLGMTTQEYQALAFVAERTGASMESMDSAVQKMNRRIGQARQGSGALSDALSKQNPALLDQVVNANSSADAFALLMDAVGKVENPMDRAALASVAFGKGNREIINTAIAGGESIRGLVDQAYQYGVVSESLEQKSGAFDDAQKNLAASFMGVRYALAEKMMPALTAGMQGVADFVSNGDKMKLFLTAVTPILAGLTAGLIAYGIVMKGQAVATAALTMAQTALNVAMSLNPAVLIVAGLVALVTAIILVRKNWDTVSWAWAVAVNSMKIVLAELVVMIADKFIPVVVKIFETLGKIPVVGKLYQGIADGVSAVTESVKAGSLALIENSELAIQNADAKYEAAKKAAAAEKLAGGGAGPGGGGGFVDPATAEKRKKALQDATAMADAQILENQKRTYEGRIALIEENYKKEITIIENSELEKSKKQLAVMSARNNMIAELENERLTEMSKNKATEITEFSSRLSILDNESAVFYAKRKAEYEQFIEQRISQEYTISELEKLTAEERIAFIQQQTNTLLGLRILEADQEVALKKATAEKINSIEDANRDAQFESMKQRLSNIGGFFQNLQTIAKNAGKESRALAVLLKGVAIAEAGLLGVKSIMQSAASAPFPANMPSVLASTSFAGAQLSTAMAIKIPSAETGADFKVPDSTRTDATLLRVNRGENVSVTPRGEDAKKMQSTSVFLDGRVILKAVQEFVDSGELRISADNIIGAY